MFDAQHIADRYIAVWLETGEAERRALIAALFAPNGRHYVGTRQVEGYAALEARVYESHKKWVLDHGYRFVAAPNAQALNDSVTFNWEMLPPEGDEVLSTGLEFLQLDPEGRVVADYQYIVKPPAT